MQSSKNHLLIQNCLRVNRKEVIESWLKSLGLNEKILLSQIADNQSHALDRHLDEILDLPNTPPPSLPHDPIPLNIVQQELALLLVGRKVFVQILRKHLNVTEREWLFVHHDFKRLFDQILQKNSATVCDICRHTMDHQLADLAQTATEIYSDLKY